MEKRLLGLMQLGCVLRGQDGHIWIDQVPESTLDEILKGGGVLLNDKIYGGITQALDTIDEALTMALDAAESTSDWYNEDIQFDVAKGADMSRIKVVGKQQGGLY